MAIYRCIRPGYFGKHLYRLGEIARCPESELPRGKDGGIIHFEQIDSSIPEEMDEVDDTIPEGAVKVNNRPRGRPKK
jgi:hypothetical protein